MSKMRNAQPIRLILIDDEAAERRRLASILGQNTDIKVIAESGDGATGIALWCWHRPDLMLLDLSMPGVDGIETLQLLHIEFPTARSLVLTSVEAPHVLNQALAAGASGHVAKMGRPGELAAAIRTIHYGRHRSFRETTAARSIPQF